MAHREPLHATARHAADFLDSLGERPIFPRATAEELRARLAGRSRRTRSTPRRSSKS